MNNEFELWYNVNLNGTFPMPLLLTVCQEDEIWNWNIKNKNGALIKESEKCFNEYYLAVLNGNDSILKIENEKHKNRISK